MWGSSRRGRQKKGRLKVVRSRIGLIPAKEVSLNGWKEREGGKEKKRGKEGKREGKRKEEKRRNETGKRVGKKERKKISWSE